jgi:toxin-antitoxin system PIN domain toxin
LIAVDTNILVYAHSEDDPRYAAARTALQQLAESRQAWAIPQPCLLEFARVMTQLRAKSWTLSPEQARAAIETLQQAPGVVVLRPGAQFMQLWLDAVIEADARGRLVFDAQIVALCRAHGIHQLLTEDRDFARFSKFKAVRLAEA